MKRLFCLILCLICLLGTFTVSIGAEKQFPDTSYANAVCLYNLNISKSVYSKNADVKIFPAGAVKMTVGLIACQMLSERLDEQITISRDMLSGAYGANIKLTEGMNVRVVDLLYGVVCGGGNDAALALANICSGNADAFVNLMNFKALEWGLSSTLFTNPTGIDDQNMYSTLTDIMTIAKLATKNELYMKISSTPSYEFIPIGSQTSIKFFNRNALISTYYSANYKYPYAQGMIVGNTDLGGHCLISFAKKGDTEYICAVMGATEDNTHIYSYKIASDLFSFAFDRFAYIKIAEAGGLSYGLSVNSVVANDSNPPQITCILKNDVYALTEKNIDTDKLTYRYYFHEQPLNAPVNIGDVVGGVDIMLEGEIIGTGIMVSNDCIDASSILVIMENMRAFVAGRFFITFVLTFTVLMIIYFCMYEQYLRHKSSKDIKFSPRKNKRVCG